MAYFRACNYHAPFSLTVKVGQRQQKSFTLYFDPSFLYGSPFPLIPTLMTALHVQTHLILIATLVAVFKLMYNLVNCFMSVHVLLESLPESLPESLSNKPSALIWHADVACCMARRCYSTRCWVRTFCATRTAEGMLLYRYTSSPRTTSPPGALGPAAAKGAPRYTLFYQPLLGYVLLHAQPPSAKALDYWAIEIDASKLHARAITSGMACTYGWV